MLPGDKEMRRQRLERGALPDDGLTSQSLDLEM